MAWMNRRGLLAGGTVAAALAGRKPRAAGLPDVTGGLTPVDPPVEAADITFQTADGTAHTLAEFRGRGMVVNFWATWCQPCVAEMPSLAALSKQLAPFDIAVMPLSSDRGGAPVVSKWFLDHDVTGLPVLLDPKGEAARTLHARGIPMTVIIDRKGMMRARLDGAADWDDPQVVTLIKMVVG
jgi:thiol-disulfide isomerase/thioredoxin